MKPIVPYCQSCSTAWGCEFQGKEHQCFTCPLKDTDDCYGIHPMIVIGQKCPICKLEGKVKRRLKKNDKKVKRRFFQDP